MSLKINKFNLKYGENIPVDKFLNKILYKPNVGYYSKKYPFGKEGDFITSPTISNLFSEIVAIWIVSFWENLGKPKKINLIELGPGDGSLSKILLNTFQRFPEFNKAVSIYLLEKSNLLINFQKKKIKDKKVKWIKNYDNIKRGPVIFFGNEYFDAIPIKQFLRNDNVILEKNFVINKKKQLNEIYKKAKPEDIKNIQSFKILEKRKFIEYPKLGFIELDKITKKIDKHSGGILLIDYGYIDLIYENTLQSVMNNKMIKFSDLIKHLGLSDITYLVNFALLNEYFKKKNLNVEKIVSQKFFLEKMGIWERAKILERKMTLKQKNYMYITLKRLLDVNQMGELFKVIFAFKCNQSNFLGFK